MPKTVLFVLATLLLTACHTRSKKERLFLFHDTYTKRNKWDSALTASSFLELRPDSSFTQDFGVYYFGHWKLADKKLYLYTQSHKTFIYRLNSLSDKTLEINFGNNQIDEFTGYDLPYKDTTEDPFSASNNHWRIRNTHPENISELKDRMLGHLHYLEKYFSWGADKDIETLNVTGFATPLKIYTNGLGIKHYDDLPDEWKSYFYNDEDCHRADSLLKHTFRAHDVKWPTKGSDFEKFTSAFQQLQKFMKED